MAIYKRDIVDINLETGNIHRSFLNHTIGYKDQQADHFGIRTFRNGEPVDLTGVSVQGVFMPPQGSPIAITSGNIVDGNVAEVVLPQACYNYNGQFTLAIKLVDSGNSITGTMRIVDGVVDNTHASGTVAPTSAVPTYQEILSTYDAMVAATAAANGAIAAAYSSSSTYAVGDYCIHDGGLYRCTTAITTAEAWTSGHWTAAKIGPDVSNLKSAFNNIGQTYPTIDLDYASGMIASGGAIQTNTARIRSASSSSKAVQIAIGDFYYIDPAYSAVLHVYNSTTFNATNHVARVSEGNGVLTIPTEYVGKYAAVSIKKIGHESDDISGDVATIGTKVLYCRPVLGNRQTDKTLTLADYPADAEVCGYAKSLLSKSINPSNENKIQLSDFTSTPSENVTYTVNTETNEITIVNNTSNTYAYLQTESTFIQNTLKVGQKYRLHASAEFVSGRNVSVPVIAIRGVNGNANGVAKYAQIKSGDENFFDFTVDEYMTRVTLFVSYGESTQNSTTKFGNIWLESYDTTGIDAEARKTEQQFLPLRYAASFTWEFGKSISSSGADLSTNQAARTKSIPVAKNSTILNYSPETDPQERPFLVYCVEYENDTFKRRVQIASGERYAIADSTDSIRLMAQYPSSVVGNMSITNLENNFCVGFVGNIIPGDGQKPRYVAFGASTTVGAIHHYTGTSVSYTPYAYPEYIGQILGCETYNLGNGTTGFMARDDGKKPNFMDMIYSNNTILSKADLITLMFGYGNDQVAGLPFGAWDDYYPYDEDEQFFVPGEQETNQAGITTMLSHGATLTGCLNWCIKWIGEHYPRATLVCIFGAPSGNHDYPVEVITNTDPDAGTAGIPPKKISVNRTEPQSFTTINTLKEQLNIPFINLFQDALPYSYYSTMAMESDGTYNKYAVFSTKGTQESPTWNSHPNEDGYLIYARFLAGRISEFFKH